MLKLLPETIPEQTVEIANQMSAYFFTVDSTSYAKSVPLPMWVNICSYPEYLRYLTHLLGDDLYVVSNLEQMITKEIGIEDKLRIVSETSERFNLQIIGALPANLHRILHESTISFHKG